MLQGIAISNEMVDPDSMKHRNPRHPLGDMALSELQQEVAKLGRALESPPVLWKPRARRQRWHFVCIGFGLVATAVFCGATLLT